MKKLIYLIIFLIVSCNRSTNSPSSHEGASTTIQQAIMNAENSGIVPALNHDNSIEGPDTNQNGIRDDVEQYIASLPDSTTQKNALMQHAKAIHSALTVQTTEIKALSEVSKKVLNSTVCLFSVYDSVQAQQKGRTIEKITVNTRERLAAYEKFNLALSGSTTKIPVGVGCEK